MLNREAYEIRLQINQLKERLVEIEGSELSSDEEMQLCASATCGHDVVLENLKKLCQDYDLKNLAVMAAWEKEDTDHVKWYSTNVSPQALSYLLRDVKSILHFLAPVYGLEALQIMQYLLDNDKGNLEELVEDLDLSREDVERVLHGLQEEDFVTEKEGIWVLTIKGWQTFIILGHLTYVLDVKVPPQKAIPISKGFLEVFGMQWGDPIEMDSQEVIGGLRKSGWLEKLQEMNVTIEDIEKAIYESRSPR